MSEGVPNSTEFGQSHNLRYPPMTQRVAPNTATLLAIARYVGPFAIFAFTVALTFVVYINGCIVANNVSGVVRNCAKLIRSRPHAPGKRVMPVRRHPV